MFEARPALLLDPADGELERYAGRREQNRHQREINRNRLADELDRAVSVEVIEQRFERSIRIDAIFRDYDPQWRPRHADCKTGEVG